eukprot:5985939-Pyramimonas_sp.AAC.1
MLQSQSTSTETDNTTMKTMLSCVNHVRYRHPALETMLVVMLSKSRPNSGSTFSNTSTCVEPTA